MLAGLVVTGLDEIGLPVTDTAVEDTDPVKLTDTTVEDTDPVKLTDEPPIAPPDADDDLLPVADETAVPGAVDVELATVVLLENLPLDDEVEMCVPEDGAAVDKETLVP